MRPITFGIFLFTAFAAIASGEPIKAEISAKSAILINAQTGRVLFEKNPYERSYPASITKVGTALYLLEQKEQQMEELATAVQDCIAIVPAYIKKAKGSNHPSYRQEPDGTSMGLQLGEQQTLKTLLFGMMLASGNDASNVIAHFVSGSVSKFLEELNTYFASLGLKNTHFNNPHGLHHPEHYTTAADMARLTKEAMKKPLFREVVKTVQFTKPESGKFPSAIFVQSNRLLRRGPYFYPKAIGVKTGYHSLAGYTLVAAAEDDQRSLIAVLLNCPSAGHRFRDAIALFEAAFAEKPVVRTLFAKQYDTFNVLIPGAKTPLVAALAEDLKITYYPSEEPEVKAFLEWKTLPLPIASGEKAGEILLKNAEGEVLAKESLFATSTVDPTFFFQFKTFFVKAVPDAVHPVTCMTLIAIFSLTFSAYYLRKKFKAL